jgi:hypothetical protein
MKMQTKKFFSPKKAFTRSLIGALALSLVSPLPAANAIANQTVSCSGGGTFRIENNIVTSSTGCTGAVIIPVGVLQIAESAFNHAPSNGVATGAAISSVVIPSTVTRINRRAFYNATLVTSIAVPNSVTVVGDYAFYGMTSLSNLTIGSGLTEIASGVFSGATSLRSISFPSTVTGIGAGAFSGATSLTAVLIPSTMTFVWDDSFNGATSLNKIYFLGAAPLIGVRAFTNTAPTATAYVTSANLSSFTLTSGKWKGLSVSLGDPIASEFITDSDTTATAAATAAVAKAAAQAAAAQREAEKMKARADVAAAIKNSKDLSVDSFEKADIRGINASNIAAVQAELLALPDASRNDFSQVLRVARKYEVVDIIASDRVSSILPNNLVEIGLIPETSKNKTALAAAVKKLPVEARDSFAEIKAAIEEASALIQKQSDRLAKILAKQSARSGK